MSVSVNDAEEKMNRPRCIVRSAVILFAWCRYEESKSRVVRTIRSYLLLVSVLL